MSSCSSIRLGVLWVEERVQARSSPSVYARQVLHAPQASLPIYTHVLLLHHLLVPELSKLWENHWKLLAEAHTRHSTI